MIKIKEILSYGKYSTLPIYDMILKHRTAYTQNLFSSNRIIYMLLWPFLLHYLMTYL